ncbi:MAG: hypothetical protein CVV24_10810 [Ignavibacteriae bacterium HGW-Ignavibacteriae-3]|nr:MAG: hypothetical protein CVV24_10810 [Ignavibacteriae bacterium HGW-Ignavibacteriae-3]
MKKYYPFFLFLSLFLSAITVFAQVAKPHELTVEERIKNQFNRISGKVILDYVRELSSDKFEGRLTGTKGYNDAAEWSVSLFKKWGLKPAGGGNSYYQKFPNPYTLVLDSGELSLNIPSGKDTIKKYYKYELDYYPGATSDSGTLTAEVVFVGYGITAPELNYDDYAGIDVKGKIVLFNPEVPFSPDKDPGLFKMWRPYSFHNYKMENAAKHGAAGVLYNYHIVNPNCAFIKGQIHVDIGKTVTDDIFSGTGKTIQELLRKIIDEKRPASFNTGKTVTMRCRTEHNPNGVGLNVIAKIEGIDPALKDEPVIIGAHLDHIGMSDKLMPGANDNASGVSVLYAAAEALSKVNIPFRRSIIFILFGAEEQGVKGSEFYIQNPSVPVEKIKAFLNLESVGRGEIISAGSGKNYPELFNIMESVNNKLVHRKLTASFNSNIARPRQDAAHFLWAKIPSISFGAYGSAPVSVPTYHTTNDKPEYLTPEIMEDLAKIVFLSAIELAEK